MLRLFLPAVVVALFTGPVMGQGQSATRFADVVGQNFFRWDTNKDGTLSTAELDTVVLDHRISGEPAVAAAVLKQITAHPEFNAPKLTLNNIQAMQARPRMKDVPGVNTLFAVGLYQVANRDAPLFETGRPQLESIRQGMVGNCFCLAPLGAMVSRDALATARMFQPWPGGGHRLTFGNGKAVTVPPLTDAELVLVSSNEGGRWVNAYERAVAEALHTDKPDATKPTVVLDVTSKGGQARLVMELLTGHKTRIAWCRQPEGVKEKPLTSAELRKLLTDNVGQRLICTGTPPDTDTPGLSPRHAYAVIGFDQRSGVVKVWNPHGNTFRPAGPTGPKTGYPTADGVFTVPLDEFLSLFVAVLYETGESTVKK